MSHPKPGHLASPLSPVRFGHAGRFELQPVERRLLVDGQPAALGGRALDVLITLMAQPDHLVSKNELLDRVWSGLVVEEANLQMQISNLRKVLGNEAIATVPGRGYRFVAPVLAPVVAPAVAPILARYPTKDAATAPPPTAPAVGPIAPALGPATFATGPTAPAAGLAAPAAVSPTPLPRAPQRLFGRDADLNRLQTLLQVGYCVTLVGPAGVGKTSLARAAAARTAGRSVWVDVAPLTQADQLAGALARALGAPLETPQLPAEAAAHLLRALRGQLPAASSDGSPDRPLLIVLDNAEHLVQACAELVAQLHTLPGLRLLVTSQQPLAVAGEQLQRLEPLALPPPGASAAELGDGALALLVERIAAADHRFTVGSAALDTLSDICQQLDGLPLALEMAAARVPLMGLQGVRDALAQRFALLTRGHRDAATRHRTLHNALDWSYRLLGADEQRLFRALGVFAGGFTLELALAALAEGPCPLAEGPGAPDDARRWQIIDGLAALADRSLLAVSADDPPRYRLLDTMRAFALQALAAAPGELETARRQHAAAMAALFMRYSPGDDALGALCLAEMENAREAIAWARTHALNLAVQITARGTRLSTFDVWRNECTQWLRALQPAMESAAGLSLPAELQAAWWTEMARTSTFLADPQASAAARRALALWQPLQQPTQALFAAVAWVRAIAEPGAELDQACAALQAQAAAMPAPSTRERIWLLGALTKAALVRGDHEAVLAGRLAEVQLARELGSDDMADTAESNVVNALNWLHRHAEAITRGTALLARIDLRNGDANANLPWVLCGLLEALIQIGRLAEARALVPRACAAGQRFATLTILPWLPLLAALQGRFEAAARLVGHVRHRFESHGVSYDAGDVQVLERAQRMAEGTLDGARVDALMRQGQGLDDDAAAALAAA